MFALWKVSSPHAKHFIEDDEGSETTENEINQRKKKHNKRKLQLSKGSTKENLVKS
jgi:hypothetical protein